MVAETTQQTIVNCNFLYLIPLLPLVGAAINGMFGFHLQKHLGRKAIGAIGVLLPWASCGFAIAAFVQLLSAPENSLLLNQLYTWVAVSDFKVNLAYSVDALSGMMVLIVTFVGSLIHVYSLGYMADDESYWRFFTYLNLFMFAMLTLVLADNMLLMFVGWEGVGLCSYLLIGFWYQDLNNAKAGMKAFVVNRIGDFGFLIGFFILFWQLGGAAGHYSLTFREMPEMVNQLLEATNPVLLWGIPVLTLAGLFFFVGAAGKSAQIPLYVWLPDAMAGPTPVSALIHAATMVTAGVYMVARMNFLYIHSAEAMTVVALVGAGTALFAATIGCLQNDIKKVLAYSTVSQLGYMFIGVGVGTFWAGSYHLLTHAFFKACLFLGAGSVILAMHHEQDMRKMGGLGKVLPLTRWTYWLSCVAISGFPIAAGFYSKDEILWQAFNSASLTVPGWIPWLLGFIAAGLTSFYMWRSYFMTFTGELPHHEPAHGHGDQAGDHGHGSVPGKEKPVMTYVLAVLAFGAVATSLLGIPMLWTGKTPILEHFLDATFGSSAALVKTVYHHGEAHNMEMLLMVASLLIATLGLGIAWWLYRGRTNTLPSRAMARLPLLHRVIYNKYYVDEIYQATVVRAFMGTSSVSNWFDHYIIDGIVNLTGRITELFSRFDGLIDAYVVDGMVNLVGNTIRALGQAIRRLQTGKLPSYLAGAALGAIVLVLLARFILDMY